ncbi:uncharacterized protein BO88DRAFT_60034 [Aspergillus vadensis CBS 113365]|uniref:Uncharacterized protein n=1 Tax=Aspergillus vadensis (strain CBS 113365 / IMI 142717 / IBT 24658) TaxID=1448311 RepID=A0A319B723_ASPVC|nr:hypothetical protein BO88DRAFT_60034 [Aspergillus vadensis CBS 113365]PYH68587.1 hypothetical protein BO88DRAFT_60034 [Aspergillus vadensis CBS 113365]
MHIISPCIQRETSRIKTLCILGKGGQSDTLAKFGCTSVQYRCNSHLLLLSLASISRSCMSSKTTTLAFFESHVRFTLPSLILHLDFDRPSFTEDCLSPLEDPLATQYLEIFCQTPSRLASKDYNQLIAGRRRPIIRDERSGNSRDHYLTQNLVSFP